MPTLDDTLAPPLNDAWIVTGEVVADATFVGRRPDDAATWLLLLTRAGEGRLNVAGTIEPVSAGELILVRPLAPPSLWTASAGWSFLWLHFLPRVAWRAWLDWPTFADGYARLTVDDRIAARLADVHRWSTGADPRRDALAANALEAALIDCDALRWAVRRPDRRIVDVAEWLCRNLERPFTLESIAGSAGMSLSRFAHRFRDEMGVSPLQYLDRQRMRRARDLLAATSLPIAQVAAAVGFERCTYFATRFRRATGESPAQFRRRRRAGDPMVEAKPESIDESCASGA